MRISFIFGVACAVLNAHKTFAYLSINIYLVAQVLPRLLPGEQIALSQVVFPIVGGAVFLLWEGWYFYCGRGGLFIVGGVVFILWEWWYFYCGRGGLFIVGGVVFFIVGVIFGSCRQVTWQLAIYLAGGLKLPGRGLLGGDAVRHPLAPLELLQINLVIGWYGL